MELPRRKVWYLRQITLRSVKYLVGYQSARVQIIPRHKSCDRSLHEPMMNRSLMHICISRPQCVLTPQPPTLPPHPTPPPTRPNGRNFADVIFNNKSASVQVMPCRLCGQCWPSSFAHICGNKWRWVNQKGGATCKTTYASPYTQELRIRIRIVYRCKFVWIVSG